jgi:hypothetical protein
MVVKALSVVFDPSLLLRTATRTLSRRPSLPGGVTCSRMSTFHSSRGFRHRPAYLARPCAHIRRNLTTRGLFRQGTFEWTGIAPASKPKSRCARPWEG